MENNFILSIKPIKQLKCHCGPACIESLLKFYKINGISQVKIGQDMHVTFRDGCFPFQVIRYLKRHNIICRNDRSKKRALSYFEKTHQPIILGEVDHFTLLVGMKDDKLIVNDPYYGKQKVKNLSYLNKVNEYMLIIEALGVNYEKKN
jgi:ABC-type bacteriocin/lantibiotic exporter with double-glycine peptidase domain